MQRDDYLQYQRLLTARLGILAFALFGFHFLVGDSAIVEGPRQALYLRNIQGYLAAVAVAFTLSAFNFLNLSNPRILEKRKRRLEDKFPEVKKAALIASSEREKQARD